MTTLMRYVFILIVLTSSLIARGQATRPIKQVDHIVIISIDGLRPDVLLRADAPNIRSLMAHGCFTFWARTTAVALTLPSHVSMLTGVIPVRHGIHWNEDLPLAKPYYPKVPTLFELAHKVGYTTAMVAAKSKFDVLNRPGTIDWLYLPQFAMPEAQAATQPMELQSTTSTVASAQIITEHVIRVLKDHKPDVLMVHFGSTDVIGHSTGWGTPEQVAEVGKIDSDIGQILKTEDRLSLQKRTAIIITSDHGGAGRTHGADDERSRNIPWIIYAPGIRQNYDLTRIQSLTVNTYDTFATACWLLGIHTPAGIDGKPITEILPNQELMH